MNILNKYANKKDKPYICIAIILGCLNHFLYDLSKGAAFIALFCPVNESVWEHLKLLFFPLLFVTVMECLRNKNDIVRFFYYRFLAVMGAMGSTVMLFYTYTGIVGRHFLIADLSIFLISTLLFFVIYADCQRRQWSYPSQSATFSMWVIMSLLFFAFTCFPPDIPLFFPTP